MNLVIVCTKSGGTRRSCNGTMLGVPYSSYSHLRTFRGVSGNPRIKRMQLHFLQQIKQGAQDTAHGF